MVCLSRWERWLPRNRDRVGRRSVAPSTVEMNLINRSNADELSTRAMEAWLFLLRHETKYTKILLRRLALRNQHSTTPVVAAGGPVLCLTSYGERLRSVHLAIESIATGSSLPSRLILWVDTCEALDHPVPGLARLVKRGLEIRLTSNYGPHTKYFPYVQSTDLFEMPLVTADDDLLYNEWWLADLIAANKTFPHVVNCFRAHRIGVADGRIAPYQTWKRCHSTEPSALHFATGVSGCIYPPSLLDALKRAGTEFIDICPKADDVWLHANALRAEIPVRQVRSRPLRFPFVPGTQKSGLYHENVLLSRNDEQIQQTYTAADIAALEGASAYGLFLAMRP